MAILRYATLRALKKCGSVFRAQKLTLTPTLTRLSLKSDGQVTRTTSALLRPRGGGIRTPRLSFLDPKPNYEAPRRLAYSKLAAG